MSQASAGEEHLASAQEDSASLSAPPVATSQEEAERPGAQKKQERSLLIDVVRGFSIILVTLGHTNQGVLRRGLWGTSLFGQRLDGFIYAFHMPAFFFVSGIFLVSSVQRRGLQRFTKEKLRTMIAPYLLWACIFGVTPWVLGSLTVLSREPFAEFVRSVATGSLSWFLPTIFFTVMLGALLRRIPMPLLFVLACAVSMYCPVINVVFVDRGIKHLPFLVLGMWVGRSYERMEQMPRAAAGFGALLVGIVLWIWLDHLPYVSLSGYRFLLFGVTGTAMLLLLARCVEDSSAARGAAWIGAASLGIFLISAYPQGFGRDVLLLLHVTNPFMQLLIPTLTATLVPAWLYQHRFRLHIAWMFAFPPRPV